MIYYAEFYSSEDDFLTIPVGFWWAIVTMTTVGYGDKHPHSSWGYLVGALCAMVGLLCAALPIPIISSNFNIIYSHEKKKEMMQKSRQLRLKKIPSSPESSPKDLRLTVFSQLNPGYAHKVKDGAAQNWKVIS
jgi:hypothetical protein